MYHMAVNPVVMEAEEGQAKILDANYDAEDIDECVHGLSHLTKEEQLKLVELLHDYPILFGGGLGKLNIKPVHLELKPDGKPYHARAFPIPQALHRTTKVEMKRLTDIDMFELNSDSEWAAPTFVQPKKTGDVRILTYCTTLVHMVRIHRASICVMATLLTSIHPMSSYVGRVQGMYCGNIACAFVQCP